MMSRGQNLLRGIWATPFAVPEGSLRKIKSVHLALRLSEWKPTREDRRRFLLEAECRTLLAPLMALADVLTRLRPDMPDRSISSRLTST
jgi:hypothetical protein